MQDVRNDFRSMHIQGGASGGPVVNSKGNVFGINSTGCDVIGDLEPYSFITPIVHALELQIDGNDGNKYSLQDLVRLNFISLEV